MCVIRSISSASSRSGPAFSKIFRFSFIGQNSLKGRRCVSTELRAELRLRSGVALLPLTGEGGLCGLSASKRGGRRSPRMSVSMAASFFCDSFEQLISIEMISGNLAVHSARMRHRQGQSVLCVREGVLLDDREHVGEVHGASGAVLRQR